MVWTRRHAAGTPRRRAGEGASPMAGWRAGGLACWRAGVLAGWRAGVLSHLSAAHFLHGDSGCARAPRHAWTSREGCRIARQLPTTDCHSPPP